MTTRFLRARSKRLLGWAALPAVMFALSSCRTGAADCFASTGLRQLTVDMAPDANEGFPVSIDLVALRDKQALSILSQLTARQYFAQREALIRQFPAGIRTLRFEIAPGMQLRREVSPVCGQLGTYLFVDYRGLGEHRIRVEPARTGRLHLGARDFSWQPDPAPAPAP